jgi:hypothetical protein
MTTAVDVTHPFNKPSADLVIRSADGVDFHVHKLIMAEASPFFEAMFSLPQAKSEKAADSRSPVVDQQEYKHGRPVLRLTEDANTIKSLLLFCYPYDNPEFSDLNEAIAVVSAAKKYQLDAPAGPVRQLLREHTEQSPLRVYAFAVRHSMEDEARAAARALLRYTLSEIVNQNPPELSDLPLAYYQRLLSFLLRCRRAFSELTVKTRWIPEGAPYERRDPTTSAVSIEWRRYDIPPWRRCKSCPQQSGSAGELNGVRKWWMEFLERAQRELMERPFGDVVKASALLEASYTYCKKDCPICCTPEGVQVMIAFTNWLASSVDQMTNEVS